MVLRAFEFEEEGEAIIDAGIGNIATPAPSLERSAGLTLRFGSKEPCFLPLQSREFSYRLRTALVH